MNTDKSKELFDKALTNRVIAAFYAVYNDLGYGFLESVYENALAIALDEIGLEVTQQAPLTVHFHERIIGQFRVDLLVEKRLVLEIKAVSQLIAAHEVQLVNYLKCSGIPIGLLLNFGPRPQFKRRIFNLLASQ